MAHPSWTVNIFLLQILFLSTNPGLLNATSTVFASTTVSSPDFAIAAKAPEATTNISTTAAGKVPAGVLLAAAESILMAAETILRATGCLYATANHENAVQEANKDTGFISKTETEPHEMNFRKKRNAFEVHHMRKTSYANENRSNSSDMGVFKRFWSNFVK